jgi:hypothetical protein
LPRIGIPQCETLFQTKIDRCGGRVVEWRELPRVVPDGQVKIGGNARARGAARMKQTAA